MTTRLNPFARDPAIAAAFDNIASMFRPPSGAEAAGWANAAKTKSETEHRKWIYENPNDPLAANRASLLGFQSYGNTQPGFMRSDETTRRGQDITAATSRANNEADNRRQAAVNFFGPLNEGQTQPAVPAQLTSMFGLPEQAGQRGTVKLSQNQVSVQPDGTALRGIDRAATPAEVAASQMQGQLAKGEITPQQVYDMTIDKAAPVPVMGADGVVRYSTPGRAAREGLPVGAAPSSTPIKRETGTAHMRDGSQQPVTRMPDGLRWQLPDGSPVPDDAKVTNMATPQGGNDQIGLPTGSNNTEANKLHATLASTEDTLNQIDALAKNSPGVFGPSGAIRGFAQDLVSTANDLRRAFGNTAPEAAVSLGQVQSLAERISPHRDPNIQRGRTLMASLAYQIAQMQNPSGEVSRQAYERSLEALSGGMLRNNDSVQEALSAVRDTVRSKRIQVDTLMKGARGTQTPPGAPGPAAVERWTRGPDGALVREPANPPGAPAPAMRLRFDADGSHIP